jgi:hypothetical protein
MRFTRGRDSRNRGLSHTRAGTPETTVCASPAPSCCGSTAAPPRFPTTRVWNALRDERSVSAGPTQAGGRLELLLDRRRSHRRRRATLRTSDAMSADPNALLAFKQTNLKERVRVVRAFANPGVSRRPRPAPPPRPSPEARRMSLFSRRRRFRSRALPRLDVRTRDAPPGAASDPGVGSSRDRGGVPAASSPAPRPRDRSPLTVPSLPSSLSRAFSIRRISWRCTARRSRRASARSRSSSASRRRTRRASAS